MAKIIDNGTPVAFLTPSHSWVLGKVLSYDVKSKFYSCTATEPENIKQDKVKPGLENIWAPRMEFLEEDVNDLLQLTELHEASLLFCLKRRYAKDVVYTNIGPIVVALNPFNYNIPHYMDAKMPDYLREGVMIENNLPHSWAVAHNTWYEMNESKQNQTVLISGESGAGKTEAAKIVVKYLGKLSTLHGTPEQQEACDIVNTKVIAASPILEAFGNAKTVRNDNSSRFGKFAKIQFDRDGFLVGSFATKYLLEKSRIITAATDERVYHSFYQLVFGADHKEYNLRSSKLFGMLSAGNCEQIEGVDDSVEYAATMKAMEDVNMTEEERKSVWRVVAGILFFQNLEFTEVEEKSGKVSSIDEAIRGNLSRACDAWDIDEAAIEKELLSTTITARGESTIKPLSKVQAQDTRDSVSRSLYDWLFEWIVNKINVTTDASGSCVHWIGLLDIFGFEDFKHNSFEQLCINLANETLQNHYNNHIFTQDMRECAEEGIDTTAVTFVDNKACIELLVGKIGILSLLDEECMVGGNLKNYLQKIIANFQTVRGKEGHPDFVAATGKDKDNAFKIKHYAAEVTYCIDSFMDKNRETVKDAVKGVLGKSNVPLIKAIVPVPEEGNSRPTAKMTVGGFFKNQLQELMAVINSTNPHWIRCIKPHPARKAKMFSHLSVMQQLRSAGVLDTVKVRKAGYPIRFKKDLFLMRYRILVNPAEDNPLGDRDGTCANIFNRLGITIETGQLGKTKVFLRQDAFLKLNHAKDEATHKYSLLFQSLGRASKVRASLFADYVKMHRARLLAERKAKEEALRRQREEEERRRREEEEARVKREKMEKLRNYNAAVALQSHVRGLLCRSAFGRNFVEESRANEERRCDDAFQKFRSTFDEVDMRVQGVEKVYFERERLQAEEAANEDMYTIVSKRRKLMAEKRDARLKAIEEAKTKKDHMLEKQVRANKERAKQEAEEKRRQLLDAEAKQREKRRTLLAAKEGHEEQLVERLNIRSNTANKFGSPLGGTQTMAERTMQQRRAEIEAEMMAELHEEFHKNHQQRRVANSNRTLGSSVRAGSESQFDFERVKQDWGMRERWERVRETRFEEDVVMQKQRREQASLRQTLVDSRQYNFPPNVAVSQPSPGRGLAMSPTQMRGSSFVSQHMTSPTKSTGHISYGGRKPISEVTGEETTLSYDELLLEAQYRREVLHDAYNNAETLRLLHQRRE